MKNNPFVRQGQAVTITIPSTDGSQTLENTFDRIFLGSGCEELRRRVSPSSPSRKMISFPLAISGTAHQIFSGFGVDVGTITSTLAQLCVMKEYLKDGDLVLVWAKVKDQTLVFCARMYTYADSLGVHMDMFTNDPILDPEYGRRAVILCP